MIWGLHVGTSGTTFWGLFFRSHFFSAPGWRPSSTPQREGGNWEASRRQGARGDPEEAGLEKVDRRLQPNAKVAFIFHFTRRF